MVSTDQCIFSDIPVDLMVRCWPWIWGSSSVPTNRRVTFDSCSAAEVQPMSGTCELASHSSHHLSYAAKTDLWNENHARMGISGHKNIRRTSVWNVLADCSGAGLVYLYLSWVVKCVRWHQTWQLSQRLVPTRTVAPPAWLCDRTSHKSPSIYISVIPSINLSLLHTQMNVKVTFLIRALFNEVAIMW